MMDEDSFDIVGEVMVLANAYRQAHDEDTMEVMNTQSSKSTSSLKKLFFYAIPTSWMKTAWPVLQGNTTSVGDFGPNWREEKLGRIENASLLQLSHGGKVSNSPSDNEEDPIHDQQRQKQDMLSELHKKTKSTQQNGGASGIGHLQNRLIVRKGDPENIKLSRDLVHTQDFFLVGSNVWLLLKQKFGFDYELKLRCTFSSDNNTLAVVLHEADKDTNGKTLDTVHVAVPPTGRFPYEDHLANEAAVGELARNRLNLPGNVSDDDTAGEGDLLPEDDGKISSNNLTLNLKKPQILLLPASNTTGNPSRNYNDNSSSTDDYWLNTSTGNDAGVMEEDDDDEDKASSDIGATVTRRRPYGSGLGNLGNTCFMNSTLQCLSQTGPLQRYFLSGEYERDLNRDNPLGTGGDLAIQFAQLLADMWIERPNRGTSRYSYGSSDSSSNVVYPRSFKVTLGKHAEQFVGYDQHDSQEFATFLLDALHEDTNRVTKKPYIEKPEQGENETDEEAANKAWDLHLKRENSRVLENFMGLIKSRLECCTPTCGRVSTTFDPCMYLSVPIPGSSERSLHVTYVPCEPRERPKVLNLTILKSATIEDLLKKVREQVMENYPALMQKPIALEDLCAADVWQKEVHCWYALKDDAERIRDNDDTFIYELRSAEEIRQRFAARKADGNVGSASEDEETEAERLGLPTANRAKRYQLDLATMTQLNRGDAWSDRMRDYLRSPLNFINAFNQKKGNTEERVKIYRRLISFIETCHREAEAVPNQNNSHGDDSTATGQKRTREEHDNKGLAISVSPDEDPIPAVEDRCDISRYFDRVRSRYDLAVLEFIAGKMRRELLRLERQQKESHPGGVRVEICMRKMATYPGEKETNLAVPFVIRIPSDMTVYGLREELACRLSRSLRSGRAAKAWSSGEPSSESNVVPMSASSSEQDVGVANMQDGNDDGFGSPQLLTLRQIPLSYERKSIAYSASSISMQLGCLDKSQAQGDENRPISLASPTEEEEKLLVAECVGDQGKVYLDWPSEFVDRSLDLKEYQTIDDETMNESLRANAKTKTKTVLDCIEKFCQKEQLEETEQWYCNKCREHVCAWKQFQIYKSPPHLIVHLKRFQFSMTTHRRNKINTFIDFPLEGLDLTQHVNHWEEGEKPIYDCYGVTNHFGGLGGGHYTAYTQNTDGVWCLYDDTRITTHVDPKDVVSQAAYVLFYRRRDVPVGQDFEVQLQTNINGIRPSPAVIHDPLESKSQSSEVSSSAAMVGDDDDAMDIVDELDENASRSTSPMGSVGGGNEMPLFVVEHDDSSNDDADSESDEAPLPIQ